jgi:hypothetical protein
LLVIFLLILSLIRILLLLLIPFGT